MYVVHESRLRKFGDVWQVTMKVTDESKQLYTVQGVGDTPEAATEAAELEAAKGHPRHRSRS